MGAPTQVPETAKRKSLNIFLSIRIGLYIIICNPLAVAESHAQCGSNALAFLLVNDEKPH